MRWRPASGFTLVELMIVIVIVAVLAGIALPAYRDQVIRGHRAAAKAELLEITNRQQQYLLANRTYATDLTTLSYTTPADLSDKYTFSLSSVNNTGVPYFQVTADSINTQAVDGDLTLDSEGVKGDDLEKWNR